jgi:7,8-dihydropterin-6-yl-methyl-4-(beta-D-ribofuranosyl)aminobenzene 5'-phosphate synthase
MRATILYDNTAHRSDLQADWGFSCYVEVPGAPRILFDTGGSGAILLSNMEKLGISPADVDEVFISHGHFDHVGGLSAVFDANPEIRVWGPPSFRGVKRAREYVQVPGPRALHENVFSTGELDNLEQFLAVRTERGIAVISGCAHPRLQSVLGVALRFGKVVAVIGGLHGFSELQLLAELELICPAHCTEHIEAIRAQYPDLYVSAGAGRIIEL